MNVEKSAETMFVQKTRTYKVDEIDNSGQFNQCFMQSFYPHQSRKHKNDSQVISHFVLWGSTSVKAARKHVGEIDPSSI